VVKGIERSSASEGVERIERTRASRTADARFERRRGIDDADADGMRAVGVRASFFVSRDRCVYSVHTTRTSR
jgi:hypothetical protein